MASASKRKKSKKKNTMESAAFQRDEIILWVVLAFSIILCLSNFGIGGSVGNKLSSVFFGLFGLVSYIFPIGLVLLTAFGLSNKGNKVAWLKVGASILFLMLLCLFMELTISGSAKDTAAAAFTYGKEHKSGGGWVDRFLCHRYYRTDHYLSDHYGTLGIPWYAKRQSEGLSCG